MNIDGRPEDAHLFDVLHERAREGLRTDKLPRAKPTVLYGGYGSQYMCALCEAPIVTSQVEYELLFREGYETGRAQVTIHFHLPCHAIYEYERARFQVK
jgi:hypothetical protein